MFVSAIVTADYDLYISLWGTYGLIIYLEVVRTKVSPELGGIGSMNLLLLKLLECDLFPSIWVDIA